ncbi:MAG: tetratricopeptide repeat protein, partial [Thermoplasmata archaeon]|nr:tetratricopeptide repeat protein [Thermoplasmata archaeon]
EDGAIAKNEEEAWTLVTDLDKLDIPSKVYDVIKRRLDRLMKEQRDILECASIVGEEFHSGIIEKTIGINKIQLLKNLSEIEKVHNLIHYLSDKYRFDHAKIKEVLYNGIGGELRKEYHRIIADTIMEINKDGIDDVVSDLAYHYFEAGDEKAGEYSLRAGNQAKERFANEEAIRFYTNALEIINDDEKIKEINENMGDINSLIGEYENAMENYQSAIKRENDVRKKADLHRRIAIAYKDQDNVDARLEECEKGLELLKNDESIEKARLLGEKGWAIQTKTWSWKDLREFFHEELRIAEKFNDKKEIAQAHHNIGKLYHEKFTDDSMKEGISHFEKALAIQEDIEDTIELSKTLFEIGVLYHNRGFMYPNEGNWDKAIEYYNRSMKIKQKIGDKYGIAWILYCIAVLHRDNDELDKALKLFEDCLEIHKKIGKKSGITQALYGMGYIYSLTGELDKALDYYEQSYEVIKQTEQELMTAAFLIDTGEIYETMGELDKALEIYDQCIDLCESSETDNKGQLEYILRLKGNVYKHKGELDNALKYHKTSFEMNSRENTPFQERRLINNHSGLAEIYIKQGNIEEAKKHAGKALDISKEIDSVHHKRISYQALAMVSREEGNWTRSMEYFEKAKETLDNDPQGVYVLKEHRSRLSYEYGLLFKAMGEPDKAKEHLDKALKGYTELSHKLWADKVQKALEELAS